jgi:hypothetical protein
VRELSTPTYTFHNGKFQLEEKQQIKKRLGFSPNFADALSTTFAIPDMPAKDDIRTLLGKTGKMAFDYDPLRQEIAA